MKIIQKLLLVLLSILFCTAWSNAYFFDSLMPPLDRHTTKPKPIKHKERRKQKTKAPVISSEIKIQTSLHKLGFYDGRMNGLLSHPRMLIAIKQMNAKYARQGGNTLDKEAQSILIALYDLWNLDKQIKYDSKFKKFQKRQTQTALKILGYYQGSIDGSMGKKTRNAIRKYQKSQNMSKKFQKKQNRDLIEKAKIVIEKEILHMLSLLQCKPIPVQDFYVPSPEILKNTESLSSEKELQLIN